MFETAALSAEPFDLCVVGAGVSGLGLARLAAARAGLRTVVLEKRGEAGGCLSSVPVGVPDPAGWLELGAHTCYNSYARFLELVQDTGFPALATSRKGLGFRMVEAGAIRSIPSCLDFLEAALSLPRIFTARKEGQTAAGYYGRILGRKNWERVLHPALNAVASQETAEFPADALFKRRDRRRKDLPRSFAVRGGLGPAVRALADLPGIRLAAEREAVALERTAQGWQVRTRGGETIQARHAALAAPADAAARLLAPVLPEAAALLGRIGIRSVKSLGLVFRDPLPLLPRLAGLILAEGPCWSAVSGDAFQVPGRRAWSFHFDGTRIDAADEMQAHACRILGADPALVEASYRRNHTMPAVTVGHDRWLEELDRVLAGSDLMLVGNYLSGLSIEDCAGRAFREFERVLART